MHIERKITVGNLISVAAGVVATIAAGAFLLYRVEATAADLEKLKPQVTAIAGDVAGTDGRLIRVETRLDFIIEQNAAILSEMRGSP